jgi:hypothetical protein
MDAERCTKTRHTGYSSKWRCKLKVVKDGFCKIHHPDYEKAELEKSKARDAITTKLWQAKSARQKAQQECLDRILEAGVVEGTLVERLRATTKLVLDLQAELNK